MKKFDIYIQFSYSLRIRKYSNYDDFTVESSDFVFRNLSFDDQKSLYWYNDRLCVDFKNDELKSDINELCLRALEFAGISRGKTLDLLSFSDCHIIDLVVSCFEQIEKNILELDPGSYLHSTGYFDDSVNPGCITVSLNIIELN